MLQIEETMTVVLCLRALRDWNSFGGSAIFAGTKQPGYKHIFSKLC